MIAGITEKEQKIIEGILDKYRKDYVFFYYGSRVKGTYEKTSDLDVLIKGKAEMPLAVLQEIKEEFDNSDLPYIVNFSDYYKLDSSFYERIKSDLIPYNWQEVKLGDVCIKITDGAHWSPKTQENGFPMASVKDMDEYGFNLSLCRKISKKDFDQLVVNDCKPIYNDVLIAKDGSFLKQVFEIKKEIDVVILSSIAIVRPNIEKIYPSFLKYIFLNPLFKEIVANHYVSGAVIPRIILKDFKQIPIPLPPLDVQKKIAGVLGALDDKIELNNKINQNLEAQAQALFKSWFIDFEPFGGKMPNDWEEKQLFEVSQMYAGGDKPKVISEKKTEQCSIPIYSNGISDDGLYGWTNEACIFEESVTVSARGTIGFVCLRLEPFFPIVRLISLLPNTELLSAKYLYFALCNEKISGTGTTQQQLTIPYFRTTKILLPSKDIMNKFTRIADAFYALIEKNKQGNARLAELRDTLLPKLMNGEIDVDNVKID